MNVGVVGFEGCSVDVDYTDGFHSYLAPAVLGFVPLLYQLEAVDPSQPFTSFELGCGHGFTTALLAAANPHGWFYANDHNPRHIRNACETAEAGGVENAIFFNKNFAELRELDLPQFDFITLPGVYSWIGPKDRCHVIEFVDRHLKPGGLVYVSYNCWPGWAQIVPLRRLLVEAARGASGAWSWGERLTYAFQLAERLQKAGSAYFLANPAAGAEVDAARERSFNYTAHEYFAADWSIFHHADIKSEMETIGLDYVGSAKLIENFEQLTIKPELSPLLLELDPPLREMVKDYALNRGFRHDLFVRGTRRLEDARASQLLADTRLALVTPRSKCELKTEAIAGGISVEVTLTEKVFDPVLDVLAAGPVTFAELTRAAGVASFTTRVLQQAVFALLGVGYLRPALPAKGDAPRRAATDRFNQAMLCRAVAAHPAPALASPVLGSGVRFDRLEQLFLEADQRGDHAIDHVRRILTKGGFDDGGLDLSSLEERASLFAREQLPLLEQLGIIWHRGDRWANLVAADRLIGDGLTSRGAGNG